MDKEKRYANTKITFFRSSGKWKNIRDRRIFWFSKGIIYKTVEEYDPATDTSGLQNLT